MLTCNHCETLIADALYGDLDTVRQERLRLHLQNCQSCRELQAELQSATQDLNNRGLKTSRFDDIPERASMDTMWDTLQSSLDQIDAERLRQIPQRRIRPFVAGALAMAASLLVFVFVFDVNLNPGEPALDADRTVATSPTISPDLMNYLIRAQTMLLPVANAEISNLPVVPIRQSTARTMAREASMMTTGMDESFSSGQSRLLKDIEFMLMQIANLEESNMEEGVRLLQQFMEDNSIFLKIRLLEMRNQGNLI